MGQRANMVIVEGGAWTLYYDHWCANTLDDDLVFGPAATLAFIRQREPVGPDHWLDDVWCEGAILVDLDREVLLFFGGEDVCYDIAERGALLAVLARTWPGWDIRWAGEGIVSIARYLNLPTGPFMARGDFDATPFRIDNRFPEDNDILFTWRRGGQLGARAICGLYECLCHGPRDLERLASRWRAPLKTWPGKTMPRGGVHLDFNLRRVSFWWAEALAEPEIAAAPAWPGWRLESLGSDLDRQLVLHGAPLDLPASDPAELWRKILDGARRSMGREAVNPLVGLVARLERDGQKVTGVNPAADIARGAAGDEAAKLALLERLEREGP